MAAITKPAYSESDFPYCHSLPVNIKSDNGKNRKTDRKNFGPTIRIAYVFANFGSSIRDENPADVFVSIV